MSFFLLDCALYERKDIKNMKGLNSNYIRAGHQACSIILITSLLLILHCYCYLRSYAMEMVEEEAIIIEEEIAMKSTEIISEIIEDAGNSIEEVEEEIEEVEKTVYEIPSSYVNPVSGNTVSYKGGKTIERSSKITYGDLGDINDLAEPDSDGFMKLDERYLIAVGSRFDTVAGQYIDLVLENGVVIECIMGDAKADVDTDSTNTFTYKSSCCSEFIIDEASIRSDIYERGNASLKYSSWDSPVVSVVVYNQYCEM